MEVIKEWAVMICAVAIGSSFCVFLIPDGKIKKHAEVGVVLIILILVSAPLRDNILPDFEQVFVAEDSYDSFEPDVMAFYGEYAEDIISAQIEEILVSVCEKDARFEIILTAEGENEIILKNISIYIDESDINKKDDIITQVGNLTGIVPEVIVKVET